MNKIYLCVFLSISRPIFLIVNFSICTSVSFYLMDLSYNLYIYLSVYWFICIYVYLRYKKYLSIWLSVYLSNYLRDLSYNLYICLSVYWFICISVYLRYINMSIYLSVCLFVCISIFLYICLSVYMSICLYVCISVCLSSCMSVCLPVCLPACMSVCLPLCLSFYLLFYPSIYSRQFPVNR